MRAAWRWRLLCVLLLVFRHAALALDPERSLDHYGRQAWRTDSGLPQNTIHSILQTRDGYLWLGTDGGLVRFDGIDFVTFDAENTPQFKSDTVSDLLQDGAGTLWISTAAGLLSYRGGAFAAYTTAQGLPADTVWFSYEDRRHRVWAITSAGLAFFDGKGFAPVAQTQAASPLNRHALAEDAQGMLWVGGSGGVFALDTRPTTPRLALHLLSGTDVEAIEFDPGQKLWIGGSEGLERYAAGTLTPVPLSHRAGKTEVTALAPGMDGSMWIGTAIGMLHVARDGAVLPLENHGQDGDQRQDGERVDQLFRDRQGVLWVATERGVFRLQGNRLQSFVPGSGLAVNRILSLYEDREGDLWVGTDSGGLNLLRDQKFTTYTTSDGLSGNLVRCVFESPQGELWIGTDGAGLNRRTSAGFAHVTTADGLSSNVILSLAGGAGGDLWIGTPNGLNLLHRPTADRPAGRIERFNSADGLPDDFIRSLYSDRDGTLWIGTRHGLAHLAGGKFTSYSSMDGLGSDFIGAIFRASQGDLWIGTSGGLSRLHDGVFTNSTMQQGLSNNTVTAIAQDAQGTLWLGTNGGGLNRLRGTPVEHGTQPVIQAFPWNSKALPGTIYGILEDAGNHLWLSSQTGIYRVSLAQLNAYRPPQAIVVDAYGTADGMNIRECSGSGHPAAWKLANGSLWFATLDGVSFIDPSHAPENRVPPPVVIEKVLVDDQVRGLDQELTVRPGANRLEFQYAGLSFVLRRRCSTATGCRALITAGSRPEAGGQPSTPICPRALPLSSHGSQQRWGLEYRRGFVRPAPAAPLLPDLVVLLRARARRASAGIPDLSVARAPGGGAVGRGAGGAGTASERDSRHPGPGLCRHLGAAGTRRSPARRVAGGGHATVGPGARAGARQPRRGAHVHLGFAFPDCGRGGPAGTAAGKLQPDCQRLFLQGVPSGEGYLPSGHAQDRRGTAAHWPGGGRQCRPPRCSHAHRRATDLRGGAGLSPGGR